MLHALFGAKRPVVFNEWGRKGGKTETIAYFLWRRALTVPGGHYYFAPEQKQAKEIFWAAGRLQAFGPQTYLDGKPNETEMRLWFSNGSFIKVDGSDNFNAYRGIEPHTAVYDEFRDFRPEFHKAFGANLSVYHAPLLICTTPPEALELDHYDSMLHGLTPGCDYFNFPSWINPHIDREWLKAEKAKLIARGEWDVWEREYGARRVAGGSNAIFPMFSRAKHVRKHADVMAEVIRDRRKLVWQVGADPGTTTVFGALIRAINPYTKRTYYLDEIYEKDMRETSTSRIVPRLAALRNEFFPSWEAHGVDWEQIYDEAAAWFQAEIQASFEDEPGWTPTRKAEKDKLQGLSLLKDQMLTELPGRPGEYLTVISDRCINLIKEIEGYIRDKDGKVPKKGDHLIDVSRYLNSFSAVDLTPDSEPSQPDPDDLPRGHRPEDEYASEDFSGLDDF